MYNFKLKDYILNDIDQILIYSTYMGISYSVIHDLANDPQAKISNPLRTDKNPSLGFKWYGNKLIMRDFADTFYRGDVFEIVGKIINKSSWDSKQFIDICNDIIRTCKDSSINLSNTTKEENILLKRDAFVIKVIDRNLNKFDYSFYNKIGYTDLMIEQFVTVVDSYYLDDWHAPYRYRTGDPSYSYIVNPNKHKLYFPTRNKTGKRFITNNRCPLECIDRLTYCDYLILIKSIKDKYLLDRVLNELGIYNILILPLASETVGIPKDIYKLLDAYTHIKIFSILDLDKAGIESMLKYKEQYDIEPIYFTAEYDSKDPTDMCRAYGYKKVYNCFQQIIDKL